MNPLPGDRRRPEYLSPSALECFEKDSGEYYIRYIAPVKAPKMAQTAPMAVGSAFDAHAKSYLHSALYGENHDPKYKLETLLAAQVEESVREECSAAGKYVFEQYKASGALSDLMLELNQAVDNPRFEFEVKGVISGYREGVTKTTMGVPLLGKPDIKFINSEGASVTYDWKVNGFYGKGNTSPAPGYVQLRDSNGGGYWTRNGSHKDAFVQRHKGIEINTGAFLEIYKTDWATQLATYGWLLGAQVGTEDIFGIDQIVCNGQKRISAPDYPSLRIASHRIRISAKFQFEVMARYQYLWGLLTSEPFYFFRDMSFEDSELRCALLDRQSEALSKVIPGSDAEWALGMTRTQ